MLNTVQIREIMLSVCDDLINREHELCEYDAVVGDGDHGTTVKKAFSSVRSALDSECKDVGDIFIKSAMAVSETMGGAIGPIFGSIFMGLGFAAKGKDSVGTEDICGMFSGALDKVQAIGGAQVGDKTLVDALSPAVDALKNSLDLSEKEAMIKACEAAYVGAQSTKDLVSKKGRSHNLGENSKGYIDAGSMTMYYFIKAFAENIK